MPTEKQIQALIAQVAAIQKQIEGFTTTLSNADRVATMKMRPGGENIVATLAQLAHQQGIALPAATSDDVTGSLTLAQRLKPLADASRQLARRLDDTIMNARGESWWAATAVYTALARVASGNPELETALAPVVEFFALGKRKKPQPPEPSTPPSSSTPPIQSAA